MSFFWVTGGLSSVLDNAPTYLTFAATAAGLERPHGCGIDPQGHLYIADGINHRVRVVGMR